MAAFAKGKVAQAAIMQLYRSLAAGGFPPLTFAILTMARSVGIEKKGSEKLRPVGIGSNLLLPLEKHLAKALPGMVEDLCQPEQYGGGMKCGGDALPLAVRFAMASQRGLVAGHFDAKNAFGTISRPAIMQVLHENESHLVPYVAQTFRSPGLSVVSGSDGKTAAMINQRGVVQGSALSPGLFCLGYQIAIGKIRLKHPSCQAVAIADDLFCIGRATEVVQAQRTLVAECKEIGLELQPAKTTFYANSERAKRAVEACLVEDEEKRAKITTDGLVVAGIPVGNRDFVLRCVEGRVADTAAKLAAIVQLPRHHAVEIFRSCIQPTWTHLWRSGTLEDLTDQGCLKHLDELERIFEAWVNEAPIDPPLHDADLRKPDGWILALRNHQRKAPREQGGAGLALVPHKLERTACFVGMLHDTLPGLMSREMFLNEGHSAIADQIKRLPVAGTDQPQEQGAEAARAAGTDNVGRAIRKANEAFAWFHDRIRRLTPVEGLPEGLPEMVAWPIPPDDLPEFLKVVWNPEALQRAKAQPGGVEALRSGF